MDSPITVVETGGAEIFYDILKTKVILYLQYTSDLHGRTGIEYCVLRARLRGTGVSIQ